MTDAVTPSQWRDDFIARVKAARIASGKKASAVAKELGVSLDTYCRWESRVLLPHQMIWPFCCSVGLDPILLLTGRPFDLGSLLKNAERTITG